jgi:ribonuclease P protein component
MAARLPPQARLKTAAQFKQTLEGGRRLSGPPLSLVYRQPAAPSSPRLGLAISRRQLPRAVDRNRIKRLARESFRQRDGLPGADVVLMASRPARERNNAQLRAALDLLWNQLTARCARSSAP